MKRFGKTLILVLCFALVFAGGVLAADGVKQTIDVFYRDIRLVVDGLPVTPKDASGRVVEPFIYDGTTYLPARALAEALGKPVSWDGETSTVYIGPAPGENIYLVDACPAYQSIGYATPERLRIMGKDYAKGISMDGWYMGYALFNLNAEYDALHFEFGHVDGTGMGARTFHIYLDGQLAATISGDGEMVPTHYDIPLRGALQMKIAVDETSYNASRPAYGFVDARLTK